MATNKKPQKKHKQKNYLKQKLKTMLVFMNWIMGPMEHMIREMKETGCSSCDEEGQLLFIDNNDGICFPMFPTATHLLTEISIMFDRYKVSKMKLNPLRTIFGLLERGDDITEADLLNAEEVVGLVRTVLGNMTVRDYGEIFPEWENAHANNRKYKPFNRRVMAM